MGKRIDIYDTTLRDGAQSSEINFSVDDKIKIAQKLAEIGITYIEGGWPGANPKDGDFFQKIKDIDLGSSKICAFSSTRRKGFTPKEDPILQEIVKSEAPIVTLFGKSWDLHTQMLKVTPEENLEIIYDSVEYMKNYAEKVFFDAEHFFDGYKNNKDYALKTLKVAEEAGAEVLVLCDTNGGALPNEIAKIVKEVKKNTKLDLGIHVHNDSELAVANTLAAVENGVTQVQGTINGFGERCGNANLISIIPNLELKMGYDCLPKNKLKELKKLSHYIYEISNMSPFHRQPFVGNNAFAHKGGIHVSAVNKNPLTYEHIKPEDVGNERIILVSDQAGQSNILQKAKKFGINITKNDPQTKRILNELKDLENKGYVFENAEASFELLMRKLTGNYKPFFKLLKFHVSDTIKQNSKDKSEATIHIQVGGKKEHTAAFGSGPVNALDKALRKALIEFYPSLESVKLSDYKVRVLQIRDYKATNSAVRVWIESNDGKDTWSTVGVSQNIIEASWEALVDSIEYKLIKDGIKNS